MYADIIIDITHEKLDKVFQYRVPEELEGDLRTGAGVIVPDVYKRQQQDNEKSFCPTAFSVNKISDL